MTASFKYVSVKLSESCAVSLWVLSLSKNEWGGQLLPVFRDDKCILSCDKKLIRGTGLKEDKDSRFYVGEGKKDLQKTVRIAVTPFFKEVFQVHPLCTTKDTVNIFFHSHPLILLSDVGMFSPPSIGDFFAHGLLSNFRNFKQNNQLNTAIVAAYEGLYIYFPLPHRFLLFKKRIEELWKALPNKTKTERNEYQYGELPMRLIEVVKMETFNDLRSGFERFLQEYANLVTKDEISISGAPVLQDTKWKCKGCSPDSEELQFPFTKFAQSEKALQFIRKNSYLDALHENGFHYEFFPAPFTSDMDFLALMRFKHF